MKRALIFGATGGIGQAIAARLAESGWSMYLHCNSNWEEANDLARTLAEKHPLQDFMPIKLNFLAGDDQLKNFASSLLPVNAVVFAQGITNYDFLGSQSSQVIDQIIELTGWHKLELLLGAPLQLPYGNRQFIDRAQTPFGGKPDNWQQDQ